MASFHTKTFTKHDDYMTPDYAWKNINHFIPKDKIIWEPFYGDGKSGEYLERLGHTVIHNDGEDFFDYPQGKGDIVVSNPPFTIVPKILERLVEIDKPFILIMPCSKITTQYFHRLFENTIQIIIPRKRIHFDKMVDGVIVPSMGKY
eukprot:Pgem_evm16s8721